MTTSNLQLRWYISRVDRATRMFATKNAPRGESFSVPSDCNKLETSRDREMILTRYSHLGTTYENVCCSEMFLQFFEFSLGSLISAQCCFFHWQTSNIWERSKAGRRTAWNAITWAEDRITFIDGSTTCTLFPSKFVQISETFSSKIPSALRTSVLFENVTTTQNAGT